MNLIQRLYPYALAAMNIGIGWLSFGVLKRGHGILFAGIGLLVFIAVIGRTVRRITNETQSPTQTAGNHSTR